MSPVTRGWVVTFAGLGINLALGVLYTWSVLAKALTRSAADGGTHLWTAQQANLPYAFAVGCFAVTMVFAGRLQDRVGPRWVATAGGALVGVGMLVASLSPARLSSATAFPFRMVAGFGVLGGIGIGLAYASATPAAVKWFSAGKKGLITGIVVSGFGLSSIYTAPLTSALISAFGVNESFLFLGVLFFVVIVGLAQLIADPPKGYVPPGSYSEEIPAVGPRPAEHEYAWQEMLRTPSFYILWVMYACVAFAGLMVIGVMAKVAVAQLGTGPAATLGFVLVAALALGNGIGRPLSGWVSDRIGRQHTMLGVFVFQALLMVGVRWASTPVVLGAFAFFIGFNYGSNLTLFPATTYDFFGTKNGGVNYGLVFTAWGAGGIFGSSVAAWVFDHSRSAAAPNGSYALAFTIAAALCLVAAALTFALRAPDPHPERCPVLEPDTSVRA